MISDNKYFLLVIMYAKYKISGLGNLYLISLLLIHSISLCLMKPLVKVAVTKKFMRELQNHLSRQFSTGI